MLHAYFMHADYFNVNYRTLSAFNRYCIMYYCIADPITRVNSGGWPIFGFGPYSTCSPSYSSLFSCDSYDSWWRTETHHCNINRDTVELQCIVDTGQYTSNIL